MVECGGLENRCGRKLTVGSNPTPSARNGHFPRATVVQRSLADDSFDDNQRAAPSTGCDLGDVTGAMPRVWPGVAALGRDGRSTRPCRARRPLAAVPKRGARRGWGEWVDFADNGERARRRRPGSRTDLDEVRHLQRTLRERGVDRCDQVHDADDQVAPIRPGEPRNLEARRVRYASAEGTDAQHGGHVRDGIEACPNTGDAPEPWKGCKECGKHQ